MRLRQMVAFPQEDRKIPISALTQSAASSVNRPLNIKYLSFQSRVYFNPKFVLRSNATFPGMGCLRSNNFRIPDQREVDLRTSREGRTLWRRLLRQPARHAGGCCCPAAKGKTWNMGQRPGANVINKSLCSVSTLRPIQTATKFADHPHAAVVLQKIEKVLIFCTTTVSHSRMHFLSRVNEPLCWNRSLWLDVASHMTSFNQLDCIISVSLSYAKICLWHWP